MNIPDPMVHGFGVKSKASNIEPTHPLMEAEKTRVKKVEQLEYALLRKTEGLHAPLRLQMEKNCLQKTGHLPFLPRSNASLNSLTGRDEMIGFEDYLGHPRDSEMMGQPHAMVEHSKFF